MPHAVVCFVMILGLVGLAPHPAWAEARQVVLLLSADSRPYQELAMAVEASLGPSDRQRLHIHTQAHTDPLPPRRDLIVTAGLRALQHVLATPGDTPVLATLVPAAAYRQSTQGVRRPTSALYIDQPPGRYLDLVRAALPHTRHVGLIVGPFSRPQLPELRRAAARRGLILETAHSEPGRPLARALRRVLHRSEALLALADPQVYNRRTLKNILLASYRQGVPVIAYSRSFVRAGALAAVYTTPSQMGLQLAETLAAWLHDPERRLPPPRYPDYFVVDVNRPLAQAMGIPLPHESVLMDHLIRFHREPP